MSKIVIFEDVILVICWEGWNLFKFSINYSIFIYATSTEVSVAFEMAAKREWISFSWSAIPPHIENSDHGQNRCTGLDPYNYQRIYQNVWYRHKRQRKRRISIRIINGIEKQKGIVAEESVGENEPEEIRSLKSK